MAVLVCAIKLQRNSDFGEACSQGRTGLTLDPENRIVVFLVSPGIFKGNLRLANPPAPVYEIGL
jgi:hypothetical protein